MFRVWFAETKPGFGLFPTSWLGGSHGRTVFVAGHALEAVDFCLGGELQIQPQQQHCCIFHHLLYSPLLPVTTKTGSDRFSLTKVHLATRGVHKLLRGLRPSDYQDANIGSSGSGSDSDSVTYKSRNELKRHARRAVRWAMDLSSFSTPQIKRILSLTYNYGVGDGRVASLDQDVLDALILVKVPPLNLDLMSEKGSEGSSIILGKMLREVEPDLMDALIQATKDSDESKLQALSGPETLSIDDNEEQEEAEETDYEEEEEGSHIDVATRWFDGLINKDVQITNEVYSISNVEFDRQEILGTKSKYEKRNSDEQ
ncbi:hypothetical protein Prudu_223S000500 [Prunus dulcis]|uniref:Uncharacterized protein n=1 Tax=Prunus dulcis TaxID=3755 RepID=A0A5H2XHQ3_PRUDU|nr:hypothetical protein Prudu_223S000500 [Prunus dulcis]